MAGSDKYRVCSGQGKKHDRWAICLSDTYYNFCPWWRAESSNGSILTYATREQAENKRAKIECEPMDARVVQEAVRDARVRAAKPEKIKPVSSGNSYWHGSCCEWVARPAALRARMR